MTTPDEFLSRVFATIDELALRLAGTDADLQSSFLRDFERRVRLKWRPLFEPYFSQADADAVVADLVARVRAKRDYLQRFGRRSA
jgi:hypothetical protein